MNKKLVNFFIFCSISIILCITIFYRNTKNEGKVMLKLNNKFIINKIHYYSSASAVSNTTNYQNPEWNLKIYQYTDIAIYLNRLEDVSEDNYIAKISITNISTESEKQEVYYLNPIMFGNSELNQDNIIENSLEYNVINSTNSEDEQNYNIPIYFQDCSNPITLRIVNKLAENYRVSSNYDLTYNGSLIKELGFHLNEIDRNLNFDLEVITKDGKKRVRRIDLEVPFENQKESILNGDINVVVNENMKF